MRHTVGAAVVDFESSGTLADVRRHTTSIFTALLTHWITDAGHLHVAFVASADAGRSAFPVIAVVTLGLAGAGCCQMIAVATVALVRSHTMSVLAAILAVRQAVLSVRRLQFVAGFALAGASLIADAVAAAYGAGGDALVLVVAYVAGYTDAGVGRRADAVRAVVLADGVAVGEDMRIAFVTLATDLDFAHIGGGSIADCGYRWLANEKR